MNDEIMERATGEWRIANALMAAKARRFRPALFAALLSSLFFVPSLAAAQAPETFREALEMAIRWVQGFVGILFGAMWIGITWGVVVYLANAYDEKKREMIRGYLLWAIIGVTVVFAVWGIIGILHASIFGGGWGIPLISPPA